jgi:uncharacterized protein (DUF302 family)
MKSFLYTVDTAKSFEAAVEAVEQKVAEKNFRVVNTYNVAATLAEQGYPRGPLKIIEVCNARFASEALEKDINVALMLPCPISVYTEGGKTFISTMRPSALVTFSPGSELEEIATSKLSMRRAPRSPAFGEIGALITPQAPPSGRLPLVRPPSHQP